MTSFDNPDYPLEDALDAAVRFLDAVDQSVERICQMPEAGAPRQLKNPALGGCVCGR
jgi:hypothetical protein